MSKPSPRVFGFSSLTANVVLEADRWERNLNSSPSLLMKRMSLAGEVFGFTNLTAYLKCFKSA